VSPRWIAPSLVAFALSSPGPVPSQQASPQGPQFQVNGYTPGSQRAAAVAADGQGRFLVTWHSFGSGGTDIDAFSVQARRFASTGSPLGGQFQVNSYTTGDQAFPVVASDGLGSFLVAWQSNGSDGTDTNFNSIQARHYDAAGVPSGLQFQVNDYTTGQQQYPAVAADGQGNFVVVWQSFGSSGTDTSGWSIQARIVDAGGAPLGGQFQVNTYGAGSQIAPAVAIDGQGSFVVAWESLGSSGTDTSGYSIQAQRYDAAGAPLGGQFQVNTYTTNAQRLPAPAADGQGRFAIAWQSFGSSGSDTSPTSIQARNFDADGAPAGEEFQVNAYTNNSQLVPAAAADGPGSFVFAWHSQGSSGTDTSGDSIQARRFDADGAPRGGDFQVNGFTTNNQRFAAVAVDGRGDFVVAWESIGSGGSDTSAESIQARRYDGLFRDGFESGGTARWSVTVP
jgi:hypothetical protein